MSSSGGDCKWYQAGCKIGQAASDGVAAIAHDLLEKAGSVLEWLSTRWLHWSPGIDTESNAVAQIQENLWWFTGMIAILGILLALGRMVLSNDFKTLIGAAKPIVNLIIVTGTYAAGIRYLDEATHALAVWMFEEIEANQDQSVGMDVLATMIVMNPQAVSSAIGGALIVGLLAIVGSAVLFGFMIFRDVVLLIMLAFIPTLAAATGTETGDQAFKKANGWLLALLLFKPVAAVILALGITLMKDNTDINGSGEGDLMRPLAGILIVCLASLALPALIKFIVPAAAAGSGAFSGGAALAGVATVAGGAAVVAATAGTGGAAAAGGAGAATTSGAAGTSGAAATGAGSAGGAAGGEAAGAAPPPGGDGGTGGPSANGAPTGDAGETTEATGDSGTGTAGAGAEGASSSSGDSSTGGGTGDGGGDTTADSAAGADQSESSTGSGGPAPQPAGGSDGGGMSASDMAVMTQALGSGAEQSTSGLDEAAEGA